MLCFHCADNISTSVFQSVKKTNEKEKKKSNLELFKEELKQYVSLHISVAHLNCLGWWKLEAPRCHGVDPKVRNL